VPASTKDARDRFRALGLRPKKSFGQNFLSDPRIASSIAELATEPAGGTVVEIGAGLGALTEPLLARASRVVAVERDRDLCPILRETFAEQIARGALEVLEADAASLDFAALLATGPRPHVVAGNLPYQITGKLLEMATVIASRIDRAVFMVQREVADRLAARAGTAQYGGLTVFVTAAFRVERAMTVGRGAFFPSPDIDSAVVVLAPEPRAEETDAFRAAVRAAFEQRRKTLRNAWRKLGPADEIERRAREAGIDLDRRGETLTVEEFARFASRLR
jgi:16S rRNA (adenine1518-N6/adenine1519-N6)-dimethyltransferase